ncbi:hypothetical protein PIROE2DRAFT_6983 [Piromyces sp. E2]|nr:hypothetical protein PIROE2DRAFT_6983 [Piromyces sp. E2]|eukprot:OUM65912.1 hypothetical protein PIROE2DRAFT_6983 [Piromyces sp. E2]
MDFDAKIPPNFNDMARNLWSQLDSMAKNNPKGYKELMTKIEEEAKKTLIPVLPTIEPCFSIKLEGTIISGSKVHYINFCKCNAVEESTKENDGGIPIVVREEDGKRKYRKYGRTFHVYDVSFNENILKRAEADPFFKHFTVTEEKYNGTFIHGHTSREGQPMPTLSQEEVNELLKNASTILNQNSEEDEKGNKKNSKNKKKNDKPIDLTPENILKQHKTYQEEMMENKNNDKINPEIESTMEKLFFSDDKKDDSKSSKKDKKDTTSKNKPSLIEEMTELVPESKKSEGLNEEEEKKKNDKEKYGKNENNSKNQFIELEGNGIPKIIDFMDDHSSEKKEQQNENDTAISEAESKIFDFLKEFDNNSGKITELDDSSNELPPSKIEELNENDELPPSKIEELNENDELPPSKIEELNENDELPPNKIEELNENDKIQSNKLETLNEKKSQNNNKSDKTSKIENYTNMNEAIPIVEEPAHNDSIPIIEEPNNNNDKETENNNENYIKRKDSTPFIEEIHDITSNTEECNSSNNNTPKIEEITYDNDISIKNEDNNIKPKIEEPPHPNDSKPIIEEPSVNNDKESINDSNDKNNNTPFIEEIAPHITETFTNDNNNTPKIEDITHDKENNEDERNNKENDSLKKENIQEQLEKKQQQLIEDINKLSINTKNEDNESIQFKSIEIPVKEKPKYLLKTSEHYLYIKVKLPKLKLIKSLQWNLSNCEIEECRPNTEKWLNVSSPEYDLKIRLDTHFLDVNNIRVTYTKSTQMLILRFNRILN